MVMDSNTTDGAYGRELLQFVMKVPLPPDSVLDRYRASICVDHGDWDGLQRYLASDLIEPIELLRIRDIILAPLDRRAPPPSTAEHHRILFELYDCQFQRAVGRFKRWARRMPAFYPAVLWGRDDIPAGRHTRYRRLRLASRSRCAWDLQGRCSNRKLGSRQQESPTGNLPTRWGWRVSSRRRAVQRRVYEWSRPSSAP